jgi:hypothetical protein
MMKTGSQALTDDELMLLAVELGVDVELDPAAPLPEAKVSKRAVAPPFEYAIVYGDRPAGTHITRRRLRVGDRIEVPGGPVWRVVGVDGDALRVEDDT